MPGKIHKHGKYYYYLRKDGKYTFHGMKHSRRDVSKDKNVKAKHRSKKGYPHAGDRKGRRV